jgi:glycosyltransferase involved in cell wall biosynthesis
MLQYFFPPLGGIASLRAQRFARYLPSFGWEPTVLTAHHGDYYFDESLSYPERQVVRTFSVELSRAARPVVRRVEAVSGVTRRTALLRWAVRRWIYKPDPQIGWYPFALAAGRRLLRAGRWDALFSSSFPVTGHLVARQLRRESGLPWVADFRDLWSDWAVFGEGRRRWEERVERSLMSEATAVVTVSPTYAEVLAARGARRTVVVTNGFDPDAFPPPGPTQSTITYLGSHYPGRQDLETAVCALGKVVASGQFPEVRLRFVGEFPVSLRSTIEDASLKSRTDWTGFIPQREALSELTRAAVLLLGGPVSCTTPALRGNVAAKTFEYLGARRPLMMVGHPDSDVATMLRALPHVRIVRPGDIEAAETAFVSLLKMETVPHLHNLTRFTSRALAESLAEILSNACR